MLLACCLAVAACTTDPEPEADAAPGAAGPDRDGPAPDATAAPCQVEGVARPVAATAVAGSDSDLDLVSFDGTRLRLHWFPLGGATEDDPAPTVLMGPGWGLAGDEDPDAVGVLGAVNIASLQEAGFNVLTWDPRGFGASEGAAQVNDPAFEGRDVQQLLEWVSTQPGAQLDGPSDPRAGMVGGSYGGGIQFVTAAQDCRVDAIVPIIGWHSLETSLFKGRVIKEGWAGLLTGVSALESVNPIVNDSYQRGLATGGVTDDAREWFISRGPGDLVERITVPTLIIQGTVDTLFTLDEGVTNFAILRGNDVPVAMVWFCGGHGVCYTDPGQQGRVSDAAIAWLRRYVAEEDVELGPAVDLLDQNGVSWTSDEFPEPTGDPVTATGSGTLRLTDGGGAGPSTAEPSAPDVVTGLAGSIMPGKATNAVDVPITFDRAALVVGAPTLALTYTGTVPVGERPTAVFAQLVDDATGLVLGNQVTPVPLVLDGAEHTATVPLEVVAFDGAEGAGVTLQLVATTVAYAEPRLGGRVDFRTIDISLPTVEGMAAGR